MNLSFLADVKLTYVGLLNNVVGFTFFMLSGLVTSTVWIYSAVAMMVTFIVTIVFYSVMLDLNETTVIMQYLVTTLLTVYCAYQSEYRIKNEFLNMNEIKKMNEDLQNILLNFPEGIVLYDEVK